jgi:hypothetical protein
VNLATVDFAGILELAEPCAATVRRLADWEHKGLIGAGGAALCLRAGEQWTALEAALAAAGLADPSTAWLVDTEDPRREDAASALRSLACDVRRGHLGTHWRTVADPQGEKLTITRVPTAELTPAVLAKRLAVVVELLREVVTVSTPGAGRWEHGPAGGAGPIALVPGGYTLGGRTYSLTGRPLALLRALLAAPGWCATAEQLRTALGVDDDQVTYPEQVIRDAAGDLRASLRRAAGLGKDQDPLPSTGRGAELSYQLHLP